MAPVVLDQSLRSDWDFMRLVGAVRPKSLYFASEGLLDSSVFAREVAGAPEAMDMSSRVQFELWYERNMLRERPETGREGQDRGLDARGAREEQHTRGGEPLLRVSP